jgi:hypothetical protein
MGVRFLLPGPRIKMTYGDGDKLLEDLWKRTQEGMIDWWRTDKDVRCQVAGLTIVLMTHDKKKDIHSWEWDGNVSIFDNEALLFRALKGHTHRVVQIKEAALIVVDKSSTLRLRDIKRALANTDLPVIEGLEINREA